MDEDIKDAAWRCRQTLVSYWRDGIQPNHRSLEEQNAEVRRFGGDFWIKKGRLGYGRDFVVAPEVTSIEIILGVAAGDRQAILKMALNVYPCDCDQFPHPRRGATLFPFQVALVQAGYELVNQGNGRPLWLPQGMHIWMIPRETRRPVLGQLSFDF